MGRISMYPDAVQKSTVKSLLKGYDIVDIGKSLNFDILPSERTLKRWIDKWKPILEAEKLADIKRRKEAEKGHKPHNTAQPKKDGYIPIPKRFLSVIEDISYNYLSSYKNKKNPATLRKREDTKDLIKILEKEKEADKK